MLWGVYSIDPKFPFSVFLMDSEQMQNSQSSPTLGKLLIWWILILSHWYHNNSCVKSEVCAVLEAAPLLSQAGTLYSCEFIFFWLVVLQNMPMFLFATWCNIMLTFCSNVWNEKVTFPHHLCCNAFKVYFVILMPLFHCCHSVVQILQLVDILKTQWCVVFILVSMVHFWLLSKQQPKNNEINQQTCWCRI